MKGFIRSLIIIVSLLFPLAVSAQSGSPGNNGTGVPLDVEVYKDAAPGVASNVLPDGVPTVDGTTRRFANMFAAKACNADPGTYLRDTYCGGAAGGQPQDFDHARFDSLYASLDDKTIYPDGNGPYTRFAVPMCEDGTSELGDDGTCTSDGKEPIRCTDGTRPVVFIRQPEAGTLHAKDWLLRVQGGGDNCGSTDRNNNCYAVDGNHFTSAGTRSRRDAGGLFTSNPPVGSPPLEQFGGAYMDKCAGDRNTGDGRVDDYQYLHGTTVNGKYITKNRPLKTGLPESDAGIGPVYFHGRRMVIALIAALARDKAISAGSRLLIVTQSNGSHGLYQYIDDVAQRTDLLVGGDVDVRGAPSSMLRNSLMVENYLRSGTWADFSTGGVIDAPQSTRQGLQQYNETFSNYPNGYHVEDVLFENPAHGGVLENSALLPESEEAQTYAEWGTKLDASCLAGRPHWQCTDAMAVGLEDVDTPLFIAAQTADHKLRAFKADFARAPGSTLEPGYGMGYHTNDFDERVRAMVKRLDERNVGHAVFVTNTDDHMSLSSDIKVTRQIGGLPLARVLYGWLMAPPGTETICLSKARTGSQAWFHVVKDTKGEYKDEGADPAHHCVGAEATNTATEEDIEAAQPSLFQSYPNPFRTTTTIAYAIEQPGPVTITVYDALGRAVKTLVDTHQPAGTHAVTWDGRDAGGKAVAAGMYVYHLRVGETTSSQQVIRVR